jgi:hypothetical protein
MQGSHGFWPRHDEILIYQADVASEEESAALAPEMHERREHGRDEIAPQVLCTLLGRVGGPRALPLLHARRHMDKGGHSIAGTC